jgi:hypothetical protein
MRWIIFGYYEGVLFHKRNANITLLSTYENILNIKNLFISVAFA